MSTDLNFSEVTGGKPSENDFPDKYNSVNIGDEEVQIKEENERIKKEIEKERKIAFNACSILKMEIDYIGNFFFGKKKEEKNSKDKIKKSNLSFDKKTFSDEEADDEGEGEGEGENEQDYTLSKFYQSNTREDLQNQLKNINFEDEDENNDKNEIKEIDCEMKKLDLLSGSDEEKQAEEEKEFTIESGGRNNDNDSQENKEKGKIVYLLFLY